MSRDGSSQDGPVFSPELEGLLREIAADPHSRLLRVPRPKVAAGYLDRSLIARDAARARTLAEKELLRVHREELALALREACLVRFYEDPEQSLFLHHHRSLESPFGNGMRDAWSEKSRAVLLAAQLDRPDLPHLDLLSLAIQKVSPEGPSIVQLARASQMICPSDVAECYEGLALVLDGNHSAGTRLMGDLVKNRATRRIASHAAENVGLAFGLSGDDARALPSYRRAWELNPSRVEPIVAWIVCAATTLDHKEVLRASAALDETCKSDHPAVRELVFLKGSQRDMGMLVPSRETRTLAARMRDAVGSASESVLNVLV